MKKQFFTIALIIITITIISNCTLSNKKVDVQKTVQNIKHAVLNANLKRNLAMNDSILHFKYESAEKSITYKNQLAAFKVKAAYEKKETAIKFENKIAEIEQNNNAMIKRVYNYQDTSAGKDNFELFKYELSREMYEQDKSIKASNI
jgi:hypothetical protein